MSNLNKRFAKDEDMVHRKIGDETILVPIHRKVGDLNNVFTLNDTAAYIWDLIDGELSVEDLRDRLVAEFDVDPQVAERDLLNCIAQLEEIQGIKEAPAEGKG